MLHFVRNDRSEGLAKTAKILFQQAAKMRELIDFAQFLKLKEEGFSYKQVEDSAGYVRRLRANEGRKIKSGKKYIEELIEWQKLNS
ncbi:MAG: hypothetical protein Q8N09_07050 [Thermodesulfovibrionia bacterium]|nr:hypothetical protein [Thermodesulfovibrionia bacterium]